LRIRKVDIVPRSDQKPWTLPWRDVAEGLGVPYPGVGDSATPRGLTSAEARGRLERFGPNTLRAAKRRSVWLIIAGQFKSLIVALLAGAALLSFAFGEWLEGIAIIAVIVINAGIGFLTELRAVRSMEALSRLGSVKTRVRRDGGITEVPAENLVPGDAVLLEGGDIVTADIRLVSASKLQADESALTGESLPVSKGTEPVGADAPLAERSDMLYKGTAVTRGMAEGLVVATGMQTELGNITTLVEEAEEEATPLEERLDQLAHRLIWVTLAIAALITAAGILTGKKFFLMIETGIALAVAAIPEGLPIVATIALARGMWRMARRNAVINRLSAVETLGATTVIFTDKTGTLTENRMTVTSIVLDSGEVTVHGESGPEAFTREGRVVDTSADAVLTDALLVAALCNNASLHGEEPVGDPLEVALLVAAAKAGIDRMELEARMPEVREEAFDSDVKMMATVNETDAGYRYAIKGAPEAVLAGCTAVLTAEGARPLDMETKRLWLERNDGMAEKGLRVIALATKTGRSKEDAPYENLSFIGLVGLLDPERSDVRESIERCGGAGIRVIMVTGDQAVTARNIGVSVGLVDEGKAQVVPGGDLENIEALAEGERMRFIEAPIFARVSPKQKLDLISIHQEDGAIVAMTGDGVNDAPALKKADIGVAMGRRGTQVAREAADMVLKDDAFSTIVTAVEQGRIIFGNIRKSILFLLSCNVSEVMIVALASLANAPLPILPLQILFLNLVTDVFPALALAVGEGEPGIMKKPPRDTREPVLTRGHWVEIGWYGFAITVAVLVAFGLSLAYFRWGEARAVTVAFLTLAFAQLWHIFNMREGGSGFIRNEVTRNPFAWGSLALCTGLLLMAVYVPGLSAVLRVTDPGTEGWILIVAMSLAPWAAGQLSKLRTGR
jgi:Ca2+-transporting ATPase